MAVQTLGIIAGNRSLPLVLARQARQAGVKRLVAVAFEGETDPSLASLVDEIVWLKVGQLSKMIAAFTVDIPVAGSYHYFQFMVCYFDTGGGGQGASVQTVENIRFCIVRQFCRLSDSGDQHQFTAVDIQFIERFIQSFKYRIIPASRTPCGLLVGNGYVLHFITSVTMYSAVNGRPS